MESKLILIRGLPGSGKSTLARELARQEEYDWVAPTIKHFEADMYHMDKNGTYHWTPEEVGNAHYWCQQMTEHSLSQDYTVIVSNTFTTLKELKPYFTIAEKFSIIPTVIHCQNNYGSIHNVPEETMKKMRNRFIFDISPLFEGANV